MSHNYDQETGLHYNYYRYYDPLTGRYLRPDPMGLEGGVNLFSYGANNPINFTDPKGLILGGPAAQDPEHFLGIGKAFDENRRNILYLFALGQVGQGNDCYAMVNIIDKAAELNTNTVDFINDLQAVLIGEGLTISTGRYSGKYYVGNFRSSGFKSEYADAWNQVQHTIAGLTISSRWPSFVEEIVLFLEGEPQDIRLYEATFRLGNQLNNTNFKSLGDKIRKEICDSKCP